MNNWCLAQLDWIIWLAVAALAAALLLGALRALRELVRPSGGSGLRQEGVVNRSSLQSLFEALKGVIEALVNAPAWFALFLAGLFLFWVASEVYVAGCKPVAPVTKVTVTSDTKTTITKTAPSTAPVAQPQRSAMPSR